MKRRGLNPMYFVERLTAATWLLSVFPFFIRRLKQQKTVYYIDGSRLGVCIARIMSILLKIKIVHFQFRMVDVFDEQGNLLSFKVIFRDIEYLQENILKRPVFGKIIEAIGVNNRIGTFLQKQAIFDMYVGEDTVFRSLFLLQCALWKAKKDTNKNPEIVFFMSKWLWPEEISRYAADYGIKIIWVRNIPVNKKAIILSLLRLSHVRFIKTITDYAINELVLKAFRNLRSGNWAIYRKRVSSISPTNKNPRLAVDYYGHLNLDKPELYSDLSFWQQSSLRGDDMVVTFNIAQDPLDDEKKSQLKRYNIEPLVLDHKASNIPSFPVFYHWPRIFSGKDSYNIPRSPEKRWVERQIDGYKTDYDYWKDLFERKNIKVYITWFKYSAQHCVIADALQNLGGVTAIYQRSFEDSACVIRTIDSDIVFAFSAYDADVQRKAKSLIPYHVIVGYNGDHRFTLLREQAQEIRRRLQENGAKHILAFFDENSVSDPRWNPGHEFMRVNYEFLLEKVLAEPWLGLVIKPKVPLSLRRRLGPVTGLLKRAEETGRCFVFEGGVLQSSYPPVIAALASDITIHGHLCAATAGVEAALAGVPTLLLDREGWSASPLYRLGKGRVVFNDWHQLWKGCKDHWTIPGGMPGFGDWSAMLDEIDPFRDGRAAERIGSYLKWLLEGFKAGLSRETVMADAAQRYTEIWGKDKITQLTHM